MTRLRRWLAPALAAAMLVTAACSTGDQPQQASENDYVQPSAAPRAPVDAPMNFDASAAVGMPDGSTAGNVALEKTTAFVNTANGVFVVDTGTNRITNIADTTHKRASNWQGDKGFHALWSPRPAAASLRWCLSR